MRSLAAVAAVALLAAWPAQAQLRPSQPEPPACACSTGAEARSTR